MKSSAMALQGPAQGDLSGLCFASAVMGADSIRAWGTGSRGLRPPRNPGTATGILELEASAVLQTQPVPPAHPRHRPPTPLMAPVLFTRHVLAIPGSLC